MTTTPLPPTPGPMNPDPAPSPEPSPTPEPPPSEPQPGPMSESDRPLSAASARVIRKDATAREHLRHRQTRDARSFGGRRTRLVKDEAELARIAALDERLLELARRAISKNR